MQNAYPICFLYFTKAKKKKVLLILQYMLILCIQIKVDLLQFQMIYYSYLYDQKL